MAALRLSALSLFLSWTLINYVASKEEKVVLTYGQLRVDFIINGKTSDTSASMTPKEWIMPDGKRMSLNDDNDKMKVLENGWKLKIIDLKEVDLGTYQFVMTDSKSSGTMTNKWTLMMISDWDRYRTNIIIGCISGITCLGLMMVICLVYHFRWRSPKEQNDYARYYVDKPEVDRSARTYDNLVFTNDI